MHDAREDPKQGIGLSSDGETANAKCFQLVRKTSISISPRLQMFCAAVSTLLSCFDAHDAERHMDALRIRSVPATSASDFQMGGDSIKTPRITALLVS